MLSKLKFCQWLSEVMTISAQGQQGQGTLPLGKQNTPALALWHLSMLNSSPDISAVHYPGQGFCSAERLHLYLASHICSAQLGWQQLKQLQIARLQVTATPTCLIDLRYCKSCSMRMCRTACGVEELRQDGKALEKGIVLLSTGMLTKKTQQWKPDSKAKSFRQTRV